jgi:hydrogenase maturation protein HypF
MKTVALSGGVAYNHAIRETIRQEVLARGFTCTVNADYPLGDGCVSFGQCIYTGMLLNTRR